MQMPGRNFSSASGYRFGFNGQEMDNEIAGKGNINTALYWEYDTRLGRRWNLDPKPDAEVSSFSCFRNNPIFLSDIFGDIPWAKITGSTNITSHLKPVRTIGGQTQPHQGLDIGAKFGSTYCAAAGGKVIAAGNGNFEDNPLSGNYKVAPHKDDGGGWGNYVVIDHGNGIVTIYAHMKKGSMAVKVGDEVKDGQTIGQVGNSGNSYGAHAHVEAIFNEDGSNKYYGRQYNKNKGESKNSHVFSIEKVNDLQDVVNGKEKPKVTMLDGSEKKIDTQKTTQDEKK
jgi:murein DD-endopeptidase MepM/ murein hydrolase activator NlpD